MLSIFTVAGGLGGFWLDPICVNLLVVSAASSPWYASEIRQWYYSKRIDSPGGEDRGNTHKDGNTLTQTGPHTPWEKEGSGSERRAGETNRNTQMHANTLKSISADVVISRERKRNDLFFRLYSTGEVHVSLSKKKHFQSHSRED